MTGLTRGRDNPAVRGGIGRDSRLVAGYRLQIVAAHQRSRRVVHRCRGLEQHGNPQ